MNKNKFKFLIFSLIIAMVFVACRPIDRNIGDNRNKRLSTQTRINDPGWDSGTDTLDDGRMDFDNDNLLDSNRRNINNPGNQSEMDLNDGMTRPDPNLSTNIGNKDNRNTELTKKIKDLSEVDDANVIIDGDRAIVGVSLRGNTQDTMTNALRDKIENIVKKSNNNIKNVSITTEPKLFKRITTISRDIDLGNPIKEFAEDIKDILRSISPDTNVNR